MFLHMSTKISLQKVISTGVAVFFLSSLKTPERGRWVKNWEFGSEKTLQYPFSLLLGVKSQIYKFEYEIPVF